MTKMIDAEKFTVYLRGIQREIYGSTMNFVAMNLIDEIIEMSEDLTIDVPPPRNCSTWNKAYNYSCNNCRKHFNFCFRFCPECGARMTNGVKST